MARAIGANATLLMIKESVYGTSPGGNWNRMPFVSCELSAERPLIDVDVLGLGGNRDAAAPFQDVVTDTGNVVVPVDLRSFGHWLRLLFGAPTSSGTDPNYTHTFVSGVAALPSNSVQVGYPDVPSFAVHGGVRADTMEIDFSPSGAATATIGLVAQGETLFASSQGGTPATLPYTAFARRLGTIKRNGSALAQITGARLVYANSIEQVRTIRSDGKIEGADPGVARVTGEITARFADTTLLTQAADGTAAEIELAYTIDANKSLTLTIHQTYLAQPRRPITGPAGIEAVFAFRGGFDAAEGEAMEVVLKNDQGGSVYA